MLTDIRMTLGGGASRCGRSALHLSQIATIVVLLATMCVAGVASAAVAAGTTYYVSQSSGNDAWDGLAASHDGTHGPWKSLAKASKTYVAGDRILLKCGDTWANDTLRPTGSGAPDNPITIASYGTGGRPVLDGLDEAQDRMGIYLKDEAGYGIVGLEFTRCQTGIFAEYSAGAPNRQGLRIENCYFHDSQLYQHYEDYPKRKIGLGICLFSHECDQKIVLSDITIRNCEFRRLASGIWTNSPDNFNKAADNIWNFANLVIDGCTFEECKQWPLGLRGIAGGAVRNCVTLDIGRHNQAWNGVAGSMIARCKDFVFEDSEWGFISIGPPGKVSGDGQAFDFECNNINHVMRRCLFHDTDGPGFLLCNDISGPGPEIDILLEDCVSNGKSLRAKENGYPKVEVMNCSAANRVTWKACRFYLSEGARLTNRPEGLTFTNCLIKPLARACSTTNLALTATASASSADPAHPGGKAVDENIETSWRAATGSNQWLQLDFGQPQTINEFRLREETSSSVTRYVIECWDDRAEKWLGCFNGMTIGRDFIAPIVSRSTSKARLMILRTAGGVPGICEFEAYHDVTQGGDYPGDPYGIRRKPIPEKVVVLTFDDSCISHATFVGPLLKKLGFGGTFYITDAFKDKTKSLSWEQIKALQDMGFEIGNHSLNHEMFSKQSVEKCTEELMGIETLCLAHQVAKPTTFCWPMFRVNKEFLPVMQEKGYLFGRGGNPRFTGERAYVPTVDNPLSTPSFSFHDTALKDKDSFINAAKEAKPGKIVVFTFHGVPDLAHPGVGTEPAAFAACMQYLKDNNYTVIAMRDMTTYVDAARAAKYLAK